MAELRPLAAGLGWAEVETYIQSGNLVFAAAGAQPALEASAREELETRFGLRIPVIVRSAFRMAEAGRRQSVPRGGREGAEPPHAAPSKLPPAKDAAEAIQERAAAASASPAEATPCGSTTRGSGTSKLSPSLIDRLVGSPATSRNYRTVLKLGRCWRMRIERRHWLIALAIVARRGDPAVDGPPADLHLRHRQIVGGDRAGAGQQPAPRRLVHAEPHHPRLPLLLRSAGRSCAATRSATAI